MAGLLADTSATLEYDSVLRGSQKVSFSLIGFTREFNALSHSAHIRRAVSEQVDPISILAPLLAGNLSSVEAGDLRVRPNPYASGRFVYAPKTRCFDFSVLRKFIWFVKDDNALKLTGATHALTPSLPFPFDAPLDLWDGTGLSASSVNTRGLKLVFDR